MENTVRYDILVIVEDDYLLKQQTQFIKMQLASKTVPGLDEDISC